MEKISLVCSNCRAKYKVTVQGEVDEKISFACRKCGTLIEFDALAPKTSQEQTTELAKTVCKNCGGEFVKNVEDNSEFCYQCRIDELIKRKREREEQAQAVEQAQAQAGPENQPETNAAQPEEPAPAPAEPAASRYNFRNAEGLVLGPIKLRTVAVLVREKRIVGNEEVSLDGGDYLPLREFPELLEFFPAPEQAPEAVDGQAETPLAGPALEEPAPELAPEALESPPEQELSGPSPAPAETPAPEPGPEPPAATPSEPEAIGMDKPGTAAMTGPAPEPEIIPEILPVPPEPKLYYIKVNGAREFGPVRKNTVLDLIECKFLSGYDQITRDRIIWSDLRVDEEFKSLAPSEEDVVELLETVDD